jgi:hypothetical protein
MSLMSGAISMAMKVIVMVNAPTMTMRATIAPSGSAW